MFDGLTNPSKYFDNVLICFADGQWEYFQAHAISKADVMDANFVIGITPAGSWIIVKNRYGRTTLE